MTGRLQDKVAIVTGAGSIGPGWGNGKAVAVLYAREGAQVLAVDLNQAAAEETAEIIRGEGGQATSCQTDVTASEQVQAAIQQCQQVYGRIDILHNNVGIPDVGGPEDIDETSWDRALAVNVRSMGKHASHGHGHWHVSLALRCVRAHTHMHADTLTLPHLL